MNRQTLYIGNREHGAVKIFVSLYPEPGVSGVPIVATVNHGQARTEEISAHSFQSVPFEKWSWAMSSAKAEKLCNRLTQAIQALPLVDRELVEKFTEDRGILWLREVAPNLQCHPLYPEILSELMSGLEIEGTFLELMIGETTNPDLIRKLRGYPIGAGPFFVRGELDPGLEPKTLEQYLWRVAEFSGFAHEL